VSSLSSDTVLIARFVALRTVGSDGVLVAGTDRTPVGKVLVTVARPFNADEVEGAVVRFFLLVFTADAEFVVIVGNFVGAITIVRPTINFRSM